jgi:hypothetical protein
VIPLLHSTKDTGMPQFGKESVMLIDLFCSLYDVRNYKPAEEKQIEITKFAARLMIN